MTAITWDDTGSRFYEAGVDRGVLYLPDGSGVPWNGLIAVNEKISGNEGTPIYFDGVKFANILAYGDFSATIQAFTYPDEFLQFEGVLEVANGMFITQQQQPRFNLSYRTMIGDDVDGIKNAYKIHVLYNLNATPAQKNHQTIVGSNAMQFEWAITAIPGEVPGFLPTAHLIFDTRHMDTLLLSEIEARLYGTDLTEASLPELSTLTDFIAEWVVIRIIDNLDGSWTAIGPDELISMLDPTTFQIIQANATYLDADTYTISNKTF